MIFRGDRREVVVVDHDDKSYVVIDETAIAAIRGQMDAAAEMMERAMENLTDEQRAAIERARQQGAAIPGMPAAQPPRAPLRYQRKGEETKAGYPCVKYEVLRGDQKVRELWVTDWGNVEGGEEARRVFLDLAEFFAELTAGLGEGGPLGGVLDSGESPFEFMKEIDGFPVVTREFKDDGSLDQESTLRSAHRRTLDPAEFEPPAGYKRRSMLGGN